MVRLGISLGLLSIYYVSDSELMLFDPICGLCTTSHSQLLTSPHITVLQLRQSCRGNLSQMGMKKDQSRRGNSASTSGNVSHKARGRYLSATVHINPGLWAWACKQLAIFQRNQTAIKKRFEGSRTRHIDAHFRAVADSRHQALLATSRSC